ncbi:MAG: DinB family protein [Paracoccaceae bacterium]
MMAHMVLMARNNAWANGALLAACARLTDDEFAAPRTGFFPSLRETLNHILSVDLYYLDALERGGQGMAVRDADFRSVAALAPAQAAADARLVAFCEGLDQAALSERVPTDRGPRGRVMERVDDLLLHLFQHQIHHRGQAHAMLSGTGVAPPQLDEFYLAYDSNPANPRFAG